MISALSMSREMNRILTSLSDRVNASQHAENTDKSNFGRLFQQAADNSGFKPITLEFADSNSSATLQPLESENLDFFYSQAKENPTELELNWAIPSCMGPHLSAPLFDKQFEAYRNAYPQEYEKLMEKKAERCKAVSAQYGLDELSREEYYYKTHGELSKEMTDFFYNGFDEEGKRLISMFFPDIAQKFGF